MTTIDRRRLPQTINVTRSTRSANHISPRAILSKTSLRLLPAGLAGGIDFLKQRGAVRHLGDKLLAYRFCRACPRLGVDVDHLHSLGFHLRDRIVILLAVFLEVELQG